jgi:hypothetical protein
LEHPRPPGEGQWLLVTEAGGLPGSVFSAYVLPPGGGHGRGWDVLIRLARSARTALEPETVSVSVWAVIAGRLVPVAAWDRLDAEGWPEPGSSGPGLTAAWHHDAMRIRQTAAFAMGIVTELEAHGADLRPRSPVDLDAAAATAAPGIWPR